MKGTKAANEKMLLCPFCGNTHQEEFTVLHETRSIGASWHDVYNGACSCGATGPDADTPEEAVERWNKREEGKR